MSCLRQFSYIFIYLFVISDVGASQLIVDGKIGLKNDSQISHFVKDDIVFENGSKLPADVVIFATGYVVLRFPHPFPPPNQRLMGRNRYGNPKDLVTELAGAEVSSRVKPVWGLNSEGEVNTCWRFSGVEGLYHMMGKLI